MKNFDNNRKFNKLERAKFLLQGFTEKEVDDFEKALYEDRNRSRFTDVEIISLNETKNNKFVEKES